MIKQGLYRTFIVVVFSVQVERLKIEQLFVSVKNKTNLKIVPNSIISFKQIIINVFLENKYMPHVLVVAYHFPPVGGAGVQRISKFIKYLENYNYFCTVIRGPVNGKVENDKTLLADIPKTCKIVNVDENINNYKINFIKKVIVKLKFTNKFSYWWNEQVLKKGAELTSEFKFDLIFCTMSPFESAKPVCLLSKKTGVPWVADLRDPWALDEVFVYSSFLHRYIDKVKMYRSLNSAERIIMNTPTAMKICKRVFPKITQKKVVSITNGYDSEDFVFQKGIENKKFQIVHAGFLHTETGFEVRRKKKYYQLFGKIMPGVDFLSRSHYYLLKAIEQLIMNKPNLKENIEIVLVGSLSSIDKEIVDASTVKNLFKFKGYLGHAETIKMLINSDLLFLPMHIPGKQKRASIVPGKTYEYMATGRPILAAVPEGDARDFLKKRGNVYVCSPNDVVAITKAIQDVYENKFNNKLISKWDEDYVAQFERNELTKKLARLFNDILMGVQ
jgi:glycosyltransferase involved in cell wall biosynthesis